MKDDVLLGDGGRIKELERTLASLREDSEVAYVLLGLSGALAEVRSVEQTLSIAVRTIPELFGAARCLAGTWDPSGEVFTVLAHSGYSGDEGALRKQSGTGSRAFPDLRRALDERTPLLVPNGSEPASHATIAIPLVRWGEDFGGLRLEFDEAREFGAKDMALARGVARQVGVALNNARRFNLLKNLRGFGSKIGSRVGQAKVIEDSLDAAMSLLAADGAWLYLLDESNRALVSAGARSDDLALPERMARISLDPGSPWAELLEGRPVTVADLGSDFGGGDLHAVAAPLSCAANPFLGALVVLCDRHRLPGVEEVEAFSVLAGQAAQGIENARRYDRERRVAGSLQHALLRVDSPELQGCEIGAVYEPADGEAQVGGDFYDVVDLSNGRVGITVGDVSGKGAEAAAQTSMVKYMLRAFATQDPAPAAALSKLNDALSRDLSEDRFITLAYALLDTERKTCSVSVAGHPPPLLFRAGPGEVEEISNQGLIVGAFPGEDFGEVTVDLAHGDVLVIYTDGLIEARSEDQEFYGVQGVAASLARHARRLTSASDLARVLYEDARRFGEVTDDTVVLALTCSEEE